MRPEPLTKREGVVGTHTYFFDAYDGELLFSDTEGSSFADAFDMRREASRILMELAADNISGEEMDRKLTVVARNADDGSRTTMTITFART